jgi:hypothetical protein
MKLMSDDGLQSPVGDDFMKVYNWHLNNIFDEFFEIHK